MPSGWSMRSAGTSTCSFSPGSSIWCSCSESRVKSRSLTCGMLTITSSKAHGIAHGSRSLTASSASMTLPLAYEQGVQVSRVRGTHSTFGVLLCFFDSLLACRPDALLGGYNGLKPQARSPSVFGSPISCHSANFLSDCRAPSEDAAGTTRTNLPFSIVHCRLTALI